MLRSAFLTAALVGAKALSATPALAEPVFNRIATFDVVANLPADRDRAARTVSEIIAASEDGRLLAYTDSEQKAVGLIDIADPAAPKPAGFIPVGGEPTSVVIAGGRAFVGVVTSEDLKNPAGQIAVIDLASRRVVATCDLGGQPDSVTLDKAKRVLAVAIENERDEKLNKGAIPQLPAGNLMLVPVAGEGVDCAAKRAVDLTGLAAVAGEDPEPEFVDVNGRGEAVVTLQENNHIAIVDVASGRVIRHFSAGTVDLDGIDKTRDNVIRPVEALSGVKREPDAVRWLDDDRFVTANEGDYEGGSRGFTIWRKDGTVEFESGGALDREAMRLGHYPERRSAAKGSEPEGIDVATFGSDRLIFVASERASLIFVYRDRGPGQAPDYLQALPTGVAPEGVTAIPSRNLLVVASEADLVEKGGARASVMIYQRAEGRAAYPTIRSRDTAEGRPLPWGALSGFAADPAQAGRLFAVTDSAYAEARVLEIDATQSPALITRAVPVTRGGKAAALDLEGIAARREGGFWLVSEGNPERKPEPARDLLIRVGADGAIADEIALPEVIAQQQTRFGFEGVAVTGQGEAETVWIAVQREAKDDPKGRTKILSYKPAAKAWGVLHYPLDTPAAGAWMGLSELTAVGEDSFVVIERDNRFGRDAVKTLQRFSVKGLTPAAPGVADVPVVTKTRLRDLGPDLLAARGYLLDKVESFAVDAAGEAFAVTDNDGVDDSSGETQFLRLGRLDAR